MIDLTEKVKGIRFKREREFALNFFDHEEWSYSPVFFRLDDGTKYFPDFHDAKREVYIEVVGTLSAFYHNQKKYDLFRSQYPEVRFEMRTPCGSIFDPADKSYFHKPKRVQGTHTKKLKNMSGASRLHFILDSKKISIKSASNICGIPEPTVRSHYYGLRKTMRLEVAAKYAAGLEVAMGELFEGGDAA